MSAGLMDCVKTQLTIIMYGEMDAPIELGMHLSACDFVWVSERLELARSLGELIRLLNNEWMRADNSDNAPLTFCPDQSICCGIDNTTCCRDGHGVWIQEGQVILTPPSSYTSTLPSHQSTTTATASPETSSSTPSSLMRSSKIGLGIGLPIGALIIGLLMYLYIRERRRRTRLETQVVSQRQGDGRSGGVMGEAAMPPYEIPAAM